MTALRIDGDALSPVLWASWGVLMRPYMVNPSSVLHVGYELPDMPNYVKRARHVDYVISELASVALDTDRLVLTNKEVI
jgi:hypothetical protein